jgi:hypothetical protein
MGIHAGLSEKVRVDKFILGTELIGEFVIA